MSYRCGTPQHENITQFLGVIIKKGLGVGLVLQWMDNGNSLDYVRKNPEVLRLPIVSLPRPRE